MVYTSDGICPCYLIKAVPSIYTMWYIHHMGSVLLPYQGTAIYLSHVVYTSDGICPFKLSKQRHLSIPCGIYIRWDLTCYYIKAAPSINPCAIYIRCDLSCYLIKAVPSIYPMWYIHQMGSVRLPYQGSAINLSHVVYTSDLI